MQINFSDGLKAYVVRNPVSGTLDPATVRERIEAKLRERNVPFVIFETTGKEDVRGIVRAAIAEGFNLFLAAGGDGTLAAVASGLVGTQIPMGIVPSGTWNGLARALNIPLPLDDALELIFGTSQVRPIDAIQVNDGFYLLNASAGIGSRTMLDVNREQKRRLGPFYDLWNGLVEMTGFHAFRFDVTIDGKTARIRATEVMVANCRYIALKAIELDPAIRMDDGKLNVCRIRAESLLEYLSVGLSMITGKQRENKNILCLEAFQEVEIRSREKLPLQADGDVIGELPARIKVVPRAVHIITPPDANP
jgi:YegS/Rv2252/BmrU family lipid kinase